MILVDTSVWIEVLRDASKRSVLERALAGSDVALSRFTQMELLQGCRDEGEWQMLDSHLEGQEYLEMSERSWTLAARVYFDLRRAGKTVRSAIDCCIAQLALENDVVLLHKDRDFQTIASVRPLRQRHLEL
jgi:predicted nucleic acid-binding protein